MFCLFSLFNPENFENLKISQAIWPWGATELIAELDGTNEEVADTIGQLEYPSDRLEDDYQELEEASFRSDKAKKFQV